jgi:TrmH family RNA methyltransferase
MRSIAAKFERRRDHGRRRRALGGGASIGTNLTSAIRDLKRRKARGRRGLALIEGVRLVEEALATGLEVVGAVAAPDLGRTARGTELRAQLESHAVPVQDVSPGVFSQLAETDTPQGIVAVARPRRWTPDDIPVTPPATLLVIDGVQDPGNVGTLLRTAHALGARASIVLRGTADVWGPKALRAAMGATFRHPTVAFDDAGFVAWARRHDITLWATAADGEPLPRALERRGPGVVGIVMGNEGAGIRPHLNAVAARRVAIPLAQGAESLNVAVAAGILLYEVTRGR